MWLWALIAVPLIVLAAFPALLVGAIAHYAAGVEHPLYISMSAGAWVLFAAAATLALARVMGLPLAQGGYRPAAVVTASGAGAAALAYWGLVTWSNLKWGYFEPDVIGLTQLIPLPLAFLTASAAAFAVVRGRGRPIALFGIGASLALLAVMAALDTRGLADGVSEWSWPLGVTYAAILAFAGLTLLTLWRSRHGT